MKIERSGNGDTGCHVLLGSPPGLVLVLGKGADQADDFALEPASVLVRLGGRDLLRRADRVPAGTALVIDDVPGIVEGRNEFYVQVTGSEQARSGARAVRVRVLRDGRPMDRAEQTLWSAPGERVEGVVVLDVPKRGSAEEPHDH